MAETPCKRCMSITTRRSTKQRLGQQGSAVHGKQRACGQRQDGPVRTTAPAIFDCSLGDADPTGYSVSVDGYSGWARGITPPQGTGTESPLARPRVLVVRGDSLGIGCTDRISMDAVVPVTFRAEHPCPLRLFNVQRPGKRGGGMQEQATRVSNLATHAGRWVG